MAISIKSNHRSDHNEPTVYSVAKDYIQKPDGIKKMIIAPTLKAYSWASFYEYPLSETSQSVQWFLQRANHLLSWEGFPTAVTNSLDAGFEVADTAFLGSLGDLPDRVKSAYYTFLSLIGLLADSVQVGEKDNIIALSAFQHKILGIIGVLGSFAMIVKAVEGLKKEIVVLSANDVGEPKHNLALVRAVSKICLIALGCFGIAAFACVELAAKVVLLTISTLLMLLSILAHFYEKLHRLDGTNTVAK